MNYNWQSEKVILSTWYAAETISSTTTSLPIIPTLKHYKVGVSVEQYTGYIVIPQYYFLVPPNFCNIVVL